MSMNYQSITEQSGLPNIGHQLWSFSTFSRIHVRYTCSVIEIGWFPLAMVLFETFQVVI